MANLHAWEERFRPVIKDDGPAETRPILVYAFNGAEDPSLAEPLRQAFAALPAVRQSFRSLEVIFLDLPAEKDIYQRKSRGPVPPFGFKAGPNWMFYSTMQALRPVGGFVFLMETDSQPLQPNWLGKLDALAARNTDAWILGGHYSGAAPLPSSRARHINGNALYNVGDPEFWEFLEGFFWNWMHEYIREEDPDLAYDCAWETFLGRDVMQDLAHPHWMIARRVLHRFRLTGAIVNVGGAAEQAGHYIWTRAHLLKRFPGALVVHGPLAVDQAHRRGRVCLGRVNNSEGVEASADQDVITLPGPKNVWERSVWLADGEFESGDEVSLRFAVEMGSSANFLAGIRDISGLLLEYRTIPPASTADGTRRAKVEHVLDGGRPYLRLEFRSNGAPEGLCRVIQPRVTITRGETVITRNLDLLA